MLFRYAFNPICRAFRKWSCLLAYQDHARLAQPGEQGAIRDSPHPLQSPSQPSGWKVLVELVHREVGAMPAFPDSGRSTPPLGISGGNAGRASLNSDPHPVEFGPDESRERGGAKNGPFFPPELDTRKRGPTVGRVTGAQ